MKTITIRLAMIFAAAFAFVSCVQEEMNPVGGEPVAEGVEFTLSLNPPTKTVNNGLGTEWTAGDKVNVFHAEAGTQNYVSDGAFEYVSGAQFIGTLAAALEAGKSYDWYVAYPYDENMTTPKAMTINIPSDQTQSEAGNMAHLSGALCPLAGKVSGLASNSSVAVTMNHLVTVMKIKVTNYEANPMDLSLVSFMANGCTHENETVALLGGIHAQTITGTYTVDFTGDRVSYTQVDKGMGTGTPRPLLHLATPETLGLNESATVYLATLPFYIPNATSLTIGMNNNSGGVEMAIYGKNVSCKAGQICGVKQGSRLAPPFKEGINFYHGQKNSDGTYTFQDGWWRCDLPSDFQFSGQFNFADLFTTCNTGDARISMLEAGNQNDRGGNGNTDRYNELTACCQGFSWVANRRWDNNFNVDYGDKAGLFLNCNAGYRVGSWLIWFRIQDPFADKFYAFNGVNRLRNDAIDGYYLYGENDDAEHALTRIGYVTGGADIAKDIHINTQYNTSTNDYSGGRLTIFKEGWMVEDHLVATDGRGLIKNDLSAPYSFGLTDEAAKYCRQSKGLYWIPGAFVEFASVKNSAEYEKRSNPESREDEAALAAELAAFGVTISENGHVILSDDYDTARKFCIHPRIKFEYDYGTIVYTYGSRYLPGLCLNI